MDGSARPQPDPDAFNGHRPFKADDLPHGVNNAAVPIALDGGTPIARTQSLDRMDSLSSPHADDRLLTPNFLRLSGLPSNHSPVKGAPSARTEIDATTTLARTVTADVLSGYSFNDLFGTTAPVQAMTTRPAASRPSMGQELYELPATARESPKTTYSLRPLSSMADSTPIYTQASPGSSLVSALAAAPVQPRRDTRPIAASSLDIPSQQSFIDYMTAEMRPAPRYATSNVVWGQTERDRVYNALLSVPYQLERLLWFGMTLCLDSFLAIFTLLPLRVAAALSSLVAGVALRKPSLRGDQLFDLLCAVMFGGMVAFLWRLKPGTIYFWVKDLTQEFLKLSVLHTALELCDKICCSFLVDVFEALAASCTTLVSQPTWNRSAAMAVAWDASVAMILSLAHGTSLMAQALVFGVAMNSQKNTLLALLIASNFTEIKGTVFKRFDPTKLFVLVSQDVIERFHLLIILSFVLVEEASAAGASSPSPRLMAQCGYVVLAEIGIDIVKHAVLGKFNDIRPGVYREFMKDVCERVASAQSYSIHKLVGFAPFASAALFLRVALSYAALRRDSSSSDEMIAPRLAGARVASVSAASWVVLVLIKISLGFFAKLGAVRYLQRYDTTTRRVGQLARPRMHTAAVPTSPVVVPQDAMAKKEA